MKQFSWRSGAFYQALSHWLIAPLRIYQRPPASASHRMVGLGFGGLFAPLDSLTVNTVPLPGSLDTVTSHGGDPTPAPLSTGVGLATSSKFFMQRTATPLTCSPSIYLPHSTNFFLDHAQVDPESLQIDLEWACNLEQSHGRFNFDDSFLIVDQSGSICALSEFTFELS
jgi:hypothetical protein